MTKDSSTDELAQKIRWCLKVSKEKHIDLEAQLIDTLGAYLTKASTNRAIEELEVLKSYDWFGEDDSGKPVYFNDEMTIYANARIAELKKGLK